jgi:hypothetical protein
MRISAILLKASVVATLGVAALAVPSEQVEAAQSAGPCQFCANSCTALGSCFARCGVQGSMCSYAPYSCPGGGYLLTCGLY